MKRVISYLTLFVVSLSLGVGSQSMAQDKNSNFDSFRENILENLSSPNPGVRESALQLVNQYSVELGLKTDETDSESLGSFQKNLEVNLASSNFGVRQSAMQLIAQYGDRFELNRDAIFSLMRTYRYEKDINFRKMALAALHKTQDKWAMEFLKISLRFEENQSLRHIMEAIVLDYESALAP